MLRFQTSPTHPHRALPAIKWLLGPSSCSFYCGNIRVTGELPFQSLLGTSTVTCGGTVTAIHLQSFHPPKLTLSPHRMLTPLPHLSLPSLSRPHLGPHRSLSVFLRLSYFTQPNVLQVQPRCVLCQNVLPFQG